MRDKPPDNSNNTFPTTWRRKIHRRECDGMYKTRGDREKNAICGNDLNVMKRRRGEKWTAFTCGLNSYDIAAMARSDPAGVRAQFFSVPLVRPNVSGRDSWSSPRQARRGNVSFASPNRAETVRESFPRRVPVVVTTHNCVSQSLSRTSENRPRRKRRYRLPTKLVI